MEDYTNSTLNPNKGKAAPQKETTNEAVETESKKIVTGTVTAKKKSGLTKFADVFIAQDLEKVKSYIIMDVIIPTVKETILESIRMILGVEGRGSGAKKPSPARTSYGRYYEREREQGIPYNRARSTNYDIDDYEVDDRGEAEYVLDELRADVAEYGQVSVAAYYELIGVTGTHADRNYGWYDLRTARIVPSGGMFVIRLPRPQCLK